MEIPGYRVGEKLGSGGMASVYRAVQLSLDRPVALKIMRDKLALTADYTKRFLREARAVARLHHRNIVAVYDVGVVGDRHFYSMRLLEGGDLLTRSRDPNADPKQLLDALIAVADALHFAHESGLIHRDVKPHNILFDEEGVAYLADFGLVRDVNTTSALTAAGLSLGTSIYMSPEQITGRSVSPKCDIYGLGVTAYEVIVGKPPYSGETSLAIAYQHVNQPLPDLPEELDSWRRFFERAMAKDPEDRYESAAVAGDALRAIRAERYGPDEESEGVAGLSGAEETLVIDAERVKSASAAYASNATKAEQPASTSGEFGERLTRGWSTLVDRVAALPQPWLLGGGAALLALLIIILAWPSNPETGSTTPVAEVSPDAGDRSDLDDEPQDDASVSSPDAESPASAATEVEAEPAESDTTSAMDLEQSETEAGAIAQRPEDALVELDFPKRIEVDSEPEAEAEAAASTDDAPDNADPSVAEEADAEPGQRFEGVDTADLLAQAQTDIEQNRLTSPEENNAFDKLAAVLEREPDNADAQAMIEAIVLRYVGMSEVELGKPRSEANFALVRLYLDRADAVSPGDERVSRLQQQLARMAGRVSTRPGAEFRDPLSDGGEGPEMVVVRGGRHVLDTDDFVSAVNAQTPFAIAVAEVSLREFAAFVDASGYRAPGRDERSCRTSGSLFAKRVSWRDPGFRQFANGPIVCVDALAAQAYAEWLSEQTGATYRLPSEAEWLVAANGLTGALGSPDAVCDYGNVADRSFAATNGESPDMFACDDNLVHPVTEGVFRRSPAGAKNMVGNVSEWLADCWNDSVERHPGTTDSLLEGDCRRRVVRGSNWRSDTRTDPVHDRTSEKADVARYTIGFRVVRELSSP